MPRLNGQNVTYRLSHNGGVTRDVQSVSVFVVLRNLDLLVNLSFL